MSGSASLRFILFMLIESTSISMFIEPLSAVPLSIKRKLAILRDSLFIANVSNRLLHLSYHDLNDTELPIPWYSGKFRIFPVNPDCWDSVAATAAAITAVISGLNFIGIIVSLKFIICYTGTPRCCM
ncbi:hypothetical protein AYI68_g3853 [Smittium mucronatum]|uniref:Uncharacterized protein n=1 Tax=Smittium mucronatum TaxID=133383 RepID=A0A1R0GYP6_9FUNG|nr:hypothetical protein AYI68_g3853 [Smittium mucronatum]